jgi:hypothetical protein
MSVGFFWLAIFPILLGGIIIAIFLFFLKREGKKLPNPENKRMAPETFIEEVARSFSMDHAEAERIVRFVFSYFPGFNWKNNLPRMRDRKMDRGNAQEPKKSKT